MVLTAYNKKMEKIPEKMTSVCIDNDGRLNCKTTTVPYPGKGQVLVKISAAPVNPSDLARIKNAVGTKLQNILTPGIEGSGRVVFRGKGVLPLLWQGRRVACSPSIPEAGTWAEYMVTSALNCIPLPSGITDEQGSMLLVNPLTAAAFIKKARALSSKAIVNTASAGALGRMIEILASTEKIQVINIVHNEDQKSRLLSQGCNYVLNSSLDGFDDELRTLAMKLDARLFLDAVGGRMTLDLLHAAPFESTILVYGNLSGSAPEVDHRSLVAEGKTITGFYLANWLKEINTFELLNVIITARKLLNKGHVIPVQQRFHISDAQKAVDTYLSGMSKGKILLIP